MLHPRFLINFSFILLFPVILHAQSSNNNDRPPSYMGSIDIEQMEAEQGPYVQTQDGTIVHFSNIAALGEKLATGEAQEIPPLDENKLKFLNEIYLLLTVKKGSAPLILDAILEADVINSRLKKTAACPNLKEFWRLWLHDDMEKKQNYMINTGLMNVANQFTNNERPKYIKCEETVRAEIGGAEDDQQFFKTRYAAGAPHREILNRAARLLEEIKKQVPNVFAANGGATPSSDDSATKQDKQSKTRANVPSQVSRRPSASR